MSRLLIVSNRLPLTLKTEGEVTRVERSAGGLATGLAGPHARSDGLWIGWPGDVGELTEGQREQLQSELADQRFVPVWLEAEDVRQFYAGFSNSVLWPLFHYLLDQLPLHPGGWEAYERVNERFAEEVAQRYKPGDVIWVHDYQLMLVPQMLRRRIPEARIGFFLHIPFPASEIFRTLPHRERILEGLLGADLVGFHTASYMRAFASSLLLVLGLAANVDRVRTGQREVRLGVFPMGVDAENFGDLASRPEVAAEVAALRGSDGCSLLVGIDRLDYTKGIPRRLLAFEQLLRDHPSLIERVRMIQVAVPSREQVGAYQEFRGQVEALIGRINGAFGTPRWVPIHYIYRGLAEHEVVALYRAADVLVVTPLRDGMNLVAKEFIASRTDEEGVLVLSELAGAASELAEAIIVNPYDVEGTADALRRALTMPGAERRARMRALRRRVRTYDVHSWVRSFLRALDESGSPVELSALAMTPSWQLERVIDRIRRAEKLLLLLDYDGTLVPYASVPELAMPDENLLALLAALAARPGTEVHLVSGSSREVVETWFGDLPVSLYAEHGFWSRPPRSLEWTRHPMPPQEWREQVRPILENFSARTPGSLIEEKTASIAWHYRMAEPVFGAFQANELRIHLTQLLSNVPIEVLNDDEDKVIELRPFGINKRSLLAPLLARVTDDTLVVAMGDDRTDEELFAALPAGALTVHVGPGPSRAEVRLPNVDAARRMLEALLETQAAVAV
ncbi:MAG TPA: bifunctional alpha,alpha-trehalose-phosphate synthase (UDP-forming)/trehalose-phosphatase [Candidatus Binatia bacterium]